jgi:hypothetical protein
MEFTMPKENVVINNRKDAMDYMTRWFETYLGAAQAGDTKVMRQMWNRMEQVNRAIQNEIKDKARLVDNDGNPIKTHSGNGTIQ